MRRMKGQFLIYGDVNPSKTRPYVNYGLIAANVAVFIWSLANFDNTIFAWGFIPVQFSFLTMLTSMFLHGGIDHIFGNMLFLYIFGDNVEDRMGHAKYLAFYLLAGMFAAFIQYATDPLSAVPTIGASGAISAVLGAYLAMFPHARVKVAGYFYEPMTYRADVVIGLWFVFQLFWGVSSFAGGMGSNIAFWAHIGGFVFGYIITKLWKKSGPSPEDDGN